MALLKPLNSGTQNYTVPTAQATNDLQYGNVAPQQFGQQQQSTVAPIINPQGQPMIKSGLGTPPKLGQPETPQNIQGRTLLADDKKTELGSLITALEKKGANSDQIHQAAVNYFNENATTPTDIQTESSGGFLKSLIGPELSAVASGLRGIQSIPQVAKAGYDLLTGNKEGFGQANAKADEIQKRDLFGVKTFPNMGVRELLGEATQAAGQGLTLGTAPVTGFGLQTLGSDVEQGKGIKQTAIDTGLTLAGGKALDLAAPYLGRVAGSIYEAAPQGVKDVLSAGSSAVKSGLEKAGQSVNPALEKITPRFMEKSIGENLKSSVGKFITPNLVENAQNNIAKQYEKVLPLTLTQRAKEATLLAKTGDNVYTTLAKNGINLGSEEAPIQLQEVSNLFETATTHAKANESAYFNLGEIKSNAFSQIDKNLSSETARQTAKDQINKEINAILKANPSSMIEGVKGEIKVNSDLVERLRKTGNEWGQYNKFNPNTIQNSAGRSLADAVRNQVEKEGTFPAYREANKEWGKIIHAQEVLGNIEKTGKQFKVSGGLSGAISRKVLGGLLGYHTAGLGGAVLGELGSDYASRILSNPELRTYFDRQVMSLSSKDLTPEAITKLQNQIREYIDKQGTLKALPPASTIFAQPKPDVSGIRVTSGPTLQQLNNTKMLPAPRESIIYQGISDTSKTRISDAEKTIYRNPKTGQMQRGYKSTSK